MSQHLHAEAHATDGVVRLVDTRLQQDHSNYVVEGELTLPRPQKPAPPAQGDHLQQQQQQNNQPSNSPDIADAAINAAATPDPLSASTQPEPAQSGPQSAAAARGDQQRSAPASAAPSTTHADTTAAASVDARVEASVEVPQPQAELDQAGTATLRGQSALVHAEPSSANKASANEASAAGGLLRDDAPLFRAGPPLIKPAASAAPAVTGSAVSASPAVSTPAAETLAQREAGEPAERDALSAQSPEALRGTVASAVSADSDARDAGAEAAGEGQYSSALHGHVRAAESRPDSSREATLAGTVGAEQLSEAAAHAQGDQLASPAADEAGSPASEAAGAAAEAASTSHRDLLPEAHADANALAPGLSDTSSADAADATLHRDSAAEVGTSKPSADAAPSISSDGAASADKATATTTSTTSRETVSAKASTDAETASPDVAFSDATVSTGAVSTGTVSTGAATVYVEESTEDLGMAWWVRVKADAQLRDIMPAAELLSRAPESPVDAELAKEVFCNTVRGGTRTLGDPSTLPGAYR